MTRLWPKSLFGQTLAVVLAGLVLSQVIGAWIYAHDRGEAVHAVGGLSAAERIANLARLIEDSPPEARDRIAGTLSDPSFRVNMAKSPVVPAAAATPADRAAAASIKDYLAGELARPHEILVSLAGVGEEDAPSRMTGMGMGMGGMGMGEGMGKGWGRMARSMGVWRDLGVAVGMEDGRWLVIRTGIPDLAPPRSWWLFAALAAMGATVLAASAWAMRRTIRPVRMLGEAALRFGRDAGAPPLDETGPTEIRAAIGAFNGMQTSLKRLMDNRSRMLAAVSHDLRTPLTLLKLRLDGMDAGEDRERMLATIAEMDAMLSAALDFARDTGKAEARRPTDIAALVASIVDDMADAGRGVVLEHAEPAVCPVQPVALRRALINLVDNALKYGGRAEVRVAVEADLIHIDVNDPGPGIPEDMLARVFEPFVRVEESRNSETGGTGLGLSIALATLRNHGGDILLANRPEGGLHARASLPMPRKAS